MRKGLRHCQVRPMGFDELHALGMPLNLDSLARQGRDEPIFSDLVRMGPGAFYGGEIQAHYSASWVLVHFLFHGDDDAHADAFVRYLESEGRGQGGPEAFFEALGLRRQELDAAVAAYLKRLRAG